MIKLADLFGIVFVNAVIINSLHTICLNTIKLVVVVVQEISLVNMVFVTLVKSIKTILFGLICCRDAKILNILSIKIMAVEVLKYVIDGITSLILTRIWEIDQALSIL